MALKDNVKLFRERLELSQLELAEKIGVKQSMIHYIEVGAKVPSLAVAISLADAFHCSLDELVGRDFAREEK